jgi:HlyD family secretion protein
MRKPAIPRGKRLAAAAAAAVACCLVLYLVFWRAGSIVLTGIVTTDDVIVSPEIQGRIARLLVREGDTVKSGQLLGTIQSDEWKDDLDYYRDSESQAAAAVAQGRDELAYQEELTEGQIGQAEASLAAAQAQVAVSESELENARLNFEREAELRKSGTDSEQAYDTARTAFDGSRARLASSRKLAVAAVAAVNLARANFREVGARKAALEGETSQLAAMEAQSRKAGVRLGYTELRAPIDGIVDVRAAREGEVVNAGQAVVTLINPDDLWVRADVEESYIDRHPPGRRTHRASALRRGAARDGLFPRGGRRLRDPARRQPHQARHQDLRGPPALRQPRPQPRRGPDGLRHLPTPLSPPTAHGDIEVENLTKRFGDSARWTA